MPPSSLLFDFAKYKTQADDTNLTPSTENGITNVLYGYDPEEVLLASAKSVAATEKRSKAAQQNSFVFSENASTAAGCGEVAFVSGGTDVEVCGFRRETGIVSGSTKDFIASAFDPTLDMRDSVRFIRSSFSVISSGNNGIDLSSQPQHMVTLESVEAGSEAPERLVCTLQ